MIAIETSLSEVFAQLPPFSIGDKSTPIKFESGNEKDLVKYLANKAGSQYPLIWLDNTNVIFDKTAQRQQVTLRLFVAKNSNNREGRSFNVIQSNEFTECLQPICTNVLTALEQSGVFFFDAKNIKFERRANYTENSKSKVIDFWNVIILEIQTTFKTWRCVNKKIRFFKNITTEGGNNAGGGTICENGVTYIQVNDTFVNPFTPSLQTSIRNNFTTQEILEFWLDNENFSIGSGGLNIYLCGTNAAFEIGSQLRTSNNNQILGSGLNGYWLANQTGASGFGSINGLEINYRFNPSRSVPYNLSNPVFDPITEHPNNPNPFTFFLDTVEPVIIKLENGVITEIIELPMTGFAYE